MSARTCKYVKCIEMMMKAYKFHDKDSIMVLRFLTQLRKACDSNGVFKDRTLHIMLMIMRDGTASCIKVQVTLHKYEGTTYRLPKTGKAQISTDAKAVNFL